MGHIYGYARVSTHEQNADLQHDALTAAKVERIFTDKASGKADRRPDLDRMLDLLLPGDVVVVWRLDRLGRSLRNLIDLITALDQRKVGFRSLTENIDTTTAGGKLIFHIFAALAEFEHQLIVDRTTAGLAAARARGRNGGRPPSLTPKQRDHARALYEAKEHTVQQIADLFGVSRKTVYRHLSSAATKARTTN